MREWLWLSVVSSVAAGCAYGVPHDAVPAEDDGGGLGASATRVLLEPTSPDASRGADASEGEPDASVLDATPDAADANAGDAGNAVDAGNGDAGGGSVWETPVCDGTVTTAEYGGLLHQYLTSTGQTWHVAWDANDLYVAIEGADVGEAAVLYVGYLTNGASAGQVYDQTAAATLSFAANAVVYAKAAYDEVRLPSGNAWAKSGTVTVCSNGVATREIAIPWSALGANMIPASFRWMGYITSASGYVYGQLPETNPSAFVGLSASFPHDYFVKSTANGGGAFPFDVLE
jgi:hypothetical protein